MVMEREEREESAGEGRAGACDRLRTESAGARDRAESGVLSRLLAAVKPILLGEGVQSLFGGSEGCARVSTWSPKI